MLQQQQQQQQQQYGIPLQSAPLLIASHVNPDTLPFGQSSSTTTKKRSYGEMNVNVPALPIVQIPIPVVTQNIAEVRKDLFVLVQKMVEEQRIRVKKLRVDNHCQ